MNNVKSTFCRICEPSCPMLVELDDAGKVVKLKPNPEHPVGGKPCNKGIAFLDIHNDPDRLNWPLKRQNPRTSTRGKFGRIGWDQAMVEVAEKITAAQQKYGKDAVAVYVGNPLSFDIRAMLTCYPLPTALDTRMVFSAGTQDCNNKNFSTTAMYGALSFLVPDLTHTDYLLCIGANPKASHWTLVSVPNDGGQILKDINARGGKVRFVNPRRVEASTPETGDTLQIKPDTDVYFLAALSHEIYQRGGFDEALLAKHGKQVDEYKAFIRRWSPDKVASVTGIEAAVIKQVAAEIMAAKSAAVYMSTGVNQGRQGVLSCWLVEMLNFATGNLGREGGIYKPVGLADPVASPLITHEMNTPDGDLPMSGMGALPAVLLPDMIERGDVKALICISGNPLLSMNGEQRLRDAFEELELLVSIDISHNATAELADYVLPATDWLEREDISAFSFVLGGQLIPHVQYTDAMEAPAAERKTDWWIVSRLLQEMGLPSQLDDADHREGFKLVDSMLAAHNLSIDAIKKLPHQTMLLPDKPKASVFDRCVVHDDKKIDCYPEIFSSGGLFERFESILSELEAEPADTLKMIGMRTTHMHNSWMANVEQLRKGNLADNRLRMCAEDAVSRDLFDGDRIRAFNENGDVECCIEVRDDMRPGVVAMTHGFGHSGAHSLKVASAKPGSNCNRLLPTGPKSYEPLSHMSWMCGVPVQVEKLVV